MPPSRRTVLQTCSLAVAGGLAGCGASTDFGPDEETTEEQTPGSQETPGDGPGRGSEGGPQATLMAQNRAGSEVTLTVELRMDGNRLRDETLTLSPGQGVLVSGDVPQPGEYVVEAALEGGASTSREWAPGEEYDGTLTAVATDEETVVLEEALSGSACGTDGLPYAIPDAPETFTTGGVGIRNESGRSVSVEVEIAHDGEVFFSCTQPLAGNQRVSVDDVVATAGTYGVTVEADGNRTEYDWRVPEGNNYPSLSVSVPEDGDPVVGCGDGGDVRVSVENPTDEARTGTLSLRRDDTSVDTTTVDVDAGESTEVTLSTPVGDFYTLVASVDGTEAQEEIVNCYCYTTDRPTVTLGESGPTIDAPTLVCE